MFATLFLRRSVLALFLSLFAATGCAQDRGASKDYEPEVGQSGKDVVWVPTSQALVDLISGQVQASFVSVPAAAPHIRSGRVRGLAVTGARRSPLVSDLPTLSEAGLKGYGSEQWYGVLVPRQTPRPVVERLNRDFAWALGERDTRTRLQDSGFEVAADTTESWFGRFLASEIAKWAGVIKKAGIKAQ